MVDAPDDIRRAARAEPADAAALRAPQTAAVRTGATLAASALRVRPGALLAALCAALTTQAACADRDETASQGAIISVGTIELQGEVAADELTSDDRSGWWVIDGNTKRVVRFDSTGTRVDSVGGEGDGPGELRRPFAVANLGGGRVIVSDGREFRMTVFDLSRKPRLVTAFKVPGRLFGTLLHAPAPDQVVGLAIPYLPYTEQGPTLYVMDINTGRTIDSVDIWQRAPGLLPPGPNRPRFIAASRAGNAIAVTLRNPFRVAMLPDSGGVSLWPNAVTPTNARGWNQHEIDSIVRYMRATLPPGIQVDSAQAVAFARAQTRPDLLHLRAFAGAADGSTWALRLQERGVALARFSPDGVQTATLPLARPPMLLRSTDDGVATVSETDSGAIVIERFRYHARAQ